MSQIHKDEFERIKYEYEQVVAILTSLVKKSSKVTTGQKGMSRSVPGYDPNVLEAALAHAEDAYAFLLIAKAEGFMRSYIVSLSVSLEPKPKLNNLIDQCRKEFNKTRPRIPIHAGIANEVHTLCATE